MGYCQQPVLGNPYLVALARHDTSAIEGESVGREDQHPSHGNTTIYATSAPRFTQTRTPSTIVGASTASDRRRASRLFLCCQSPGVCGFAVPLRGNGSLVGGGAVHRCAGARICVLARRGAFLGCFSQSGANLHPHLWSRIERVVSADNAFLVALAEPRSLLASARGVRSPSPPSFVGGAGGCQCNKKSVIRGHVRRGGASPLPG